MPGQPVSLLTRFNSLVARHLGIPIGFAIAVVISLGICRLLSPNQSNNWVIGLYLLPVLVQIAGLLMLSGRLPKEPHNSGAFHAHHAERHALEAFAVFYVITTFICSVGYIVLSAFYLWKEEFNRWTEDVSNWPLDDSLDALSYLALILISALLFLSVFMTWAVISGSIIRDDKDVEAPPNAGTSAAPPAEDAAAGRAPRGFGPLDKLKTGAAQEPFLIMLFFFTVFLGIAHLFGLALAFHDKNEFKRTGSPALYMRSIRADNTPTPSRTYHSAAVSAYSARAGNAPAPTPTPAPSASPTPTPTPPPTRPSTSRRPAPC